MNHFIRKFFGFLTRLPFIGSTARNFILWPLSNKIFPKNYSEIIRLKNGINIKVHQDIFDMTNKSLMYWGEVEQYPYEPVTSRRVEELIKDKHAVLVAGAHFGYYPLLICSIKQMPVYAFEPGTKMFSYLKENLELNNAHTVIPVQMALSDNIGRAKFVANSGQSSLVQYPGSKSEQIEEVSTTTIDTYLQDIPVKPDLFILDLEGYEMRVLSGAKDFIRSFKPTVIVEVNSKMLMKAGTSAQELYDLLASMHYTWQRLEDDSNADDWFNILALPI